MVSKAATEPTLECSYLVVAIKIKIFFRFQCVGIRLFWRRLYTLRHV